MRLSRAQRMHESSDKHGGFVGKKDTTSNLEEQSSSQMVLVPDVRERELQSKEHPRHHSLKCPQSDISHLVLNTPKRANELIESSSEKDSSCCLRFQLGISPFFLLLPWSLLYHILALLLLPSSPVLWDHISVYSNGKCFQVLLPAHYLATYQTGLACLSYLYILRGLNSMRISHPSMGHTPRLNQSPS